MASVRLSNALKSLIAAPHAAGGPLPAPPQVATTALFERLADEKRVGEATWLTIGTAALVTLNSPATLTALYSFAVGRLESQQAKAEEAVRYAAIMREAGLKTISFSGIPRAINNLGALRAHLDPAVAERLPTSPTREPSPSTLSAVFSSASQLWTSIYQPHSHKLISKLSSSHPDLPVHILSSHYGPLLSDPPSSPNVLGGKVGRILTSVVAIACLRAQGGVGPQVTSHVFGLLKAREELEKLEEDKEEAIEGAEWLTSEEGATWVVEQVDRIVEVVSGGKGSSFGTRAKL
ncbi:hypothetical protein JCM8547_005239 [Rhodosporidiobolus lusitaniae]